WQLLDLEAGCKLRRRFVPAELRGRAPGIRDQEAGLVSHLEGQPRRRYRLLRRDTQAQRQRLAAEELRARRSVRAEQLHALDPRGPGSPLLQTGAPLSRIEVTRELLAVTHDRVVRRPVELDTAVSQQHGTVAKTLDRCGVVRDEDNRAAALLELEDLAEALALKLLVADRED